MSLTRVSSSSHANAVQKTGINHDYGIFDSPDAFYAKHGSNLSGPKRFLYGYVVRHFMNATIARIRRRSLCASPEQAVSGMLRG